MAQQQPTVADIFRRAQSLRKDHSDWSYKQMQEQLVKDLSGGPFPSLHNLTIPEQDERARGPEGDRDKWHDRSVGIDDAEAKGISKWMPDELLALAERKGKKSV